MHIYMYFNSPSFTSISLDCGVLCAAIGARHGDAKRRREELLRERSLTIAVKTGYPINFQTKPSLRIDHGVFKSVPAGSSSQAESIPVEVGRCATVLSSLVFKRFPRAIHPWRVTHIRSCCFALQNHTRVTPNATQPTTSPQQYVLTNLPMNPTRLSERASETSTFCMFCVIDSSLPRPHPVGA